MVGRVGGECVVEAAVVGKCAIKVEDSQVVTEGYEHSVARAHQLVECGVPTDVSRVLHVYTPIKVQDSRTATVGFGQHIELCETFTHASI